MPTWFYVLLGLLIAFSFGLLLWKLAIWVHWDESRREGFKNWKAIHKGCVPPTPPSSPS